MIVTLEGVQGSGKSLTATALGYADHVKTGVRVISNNHYNFEAELFDTKYFIDHMEDTILENCVLVLDESYLLMDARSGSTKLNKVMTYFTVQTRKRGVDLYLCIHHIDVIDKRVRRAVDIRGTCRYRKEKPCMACGGTGIATEEVASGVKVRKGKPALLWMSKGRCVPVYITKTETYHGHYIVNMRDAETDAKIQLKDPTLTTKKDTPEIVWDSFFPSEKVEAEEPEEVQAEESQPDEVEQLVKAGVAATTSKEPPQMVNDEPSNNQEYQQPTGVLEADEEFPEKPDYDPSVGEPPQEPTHLAPEGPSDSPKLMAGEVPAHLRCPRCLGYGETGWGTTKFVWQNTGAVRRIKVFGPAVFPLYSTEERIPLTKKQMRINADDL